MTAGVPDTRFRDQLAEVLRTHRLAGEDHEGAMVCACGWVGASLARHQAGYVTAEVEARVQAAANQRAIEQLEAAARDDAVSTHRLTPVEVLTLRVVKVHSLLVRAAALASPAPGAES